MQWLKTRLRSYWHHKTICGTGSKHILRITYDTCVTKTNTEELDIKLINIGMKYKVAKLQMGLKDVAFLPSRACLYNMVLKNCGRG